MLKSLVLIIVSFFFSITSYADTKIPFTLDWKFEGPSAPFFNAIDKGYFKDVGLDVEISPGKGSLDAIPKVATGKATSSGSIYPTMLPKTAPVLPMKNAAIAQPTCL